MLLKAHISDVKEPSKLLPSGSFITCSSDNTIRIWNYDTHSSPDKTARKCNFYSNVCYADSLSHLFTVCLDSTMCKRCVVIFMGLCYVCQCGLHCGWSSVCTTRSRYLLATTSIWLGVATLTELV